MFVIVTYDVNVKRNNKVLKICRKYLVHCQKSVFEGNITEAKLRKLKAEIKNIIRPDEDSVMIYRFDSLKYSSKEVFWNFTRARKNLGQVMNVRWEFILIGMA